MAARAKLSKRPITLLDYQVDSHEEMLGILEWSHIAFNTSDTGLGKTPATLALCAARESRMLVFANSRYEEVWMREYAKYQLPMLIDFVSYETMSRGDVFITYMDKYGDEVKARILRRIVIKKPAKKAGAKPREVIFYEPTAFFRQMLAKPKAGAGYSGITLIFDEVDALKNPSNVNRATRAIGRLIASLGGTNRMIFLSATPFDKIEHADAMCRAMGFITLPRLSHTNPQTGEFVPDGLAELIDVCAQDQMRYELVAEDDHEEYMDRLEPVLFHYKWDTRKYSSIKSNKKLVASLFEEVVMPAISSAMPPVNIPSMIYRGFFNITKSQDRDLIEAATERLQGILEYNVDLDTITQKSEKSMRPAVFAELHKIELGCVNDLCRFFHRKLLDPKHPRDKVILGFNFNDAISAAQDYFRRVGIKVIVLAGSVNGERLGIKKRNELVKRFYSDDRLQVILGNLAVISRAINLHDTSPKGDHKRWMGIMPDYNMTKLKQTPGRIFRAGATSVGECYYFFPRNVPALAGMLSALTRKSQVTASLLRQEHRGLIKFPGDQPRYIEPLKGEHIINPQTGEEMPNGGFLDESQIPRKRIAGGQTKEAPILKILTFIQAGLPVPFMEQVMLEPNWDLVRQMREIAGDTAAVSGKPRAAVASGAAPSSSREAEVPQTKEEKLAAYRAKQQAAAPVQPARPSTSAPQPRTSVLPPRPTTGSRPGPSKAPARGFNFSDDEDSDYGSDGEESDEEEEGYEGLAAGVASDEEEAEAEELEPFDILED